MSQIEICSSPIAALTRKIDALRYLISTVDQICPLRMRLPNQKRIPSSGFKGLNVRHRPAKHSLGTVVLNNQGALHISRRKSLVEI